MRGYVPGKVGLGEGVEGVWVVVVAERNDTKTTYT